MEYIVSLNLALLESYHISSAIRQNFFLPKQSQKPRSILYDGSRSLWLFREGKTHIIAKVHKTDSVICSHSREGKALSYSQINTVHNFDIFRAIMLRCASFGPYKNIMIAISVFLSCTFSFFVFFPHLYLHSCLYVTCSAILVLVAVQLHLQKTWF